VGEQNETTSEREGKGREESKWKWCVGGGMWRWGVRCGGGAWHVEVVCDVEVRV